jgi:Thioesterase domain
VALIRNLKPEGPLLLTGYCFRGALAFEVAQQLQREGIAVAGVILLDTWMHLPSVWWRKMTWIRGHVLNAFRNGPSYVWQKFRMRVEFERDQIDAERRMACGGVAGKEVPWVITERIYRHAMYGYNAPQASCRGIVLTPRDDWMVKSYRPIDDSLGARRLFPEGLEVIELPGTHINILNRSNLPEVAKGYRVVFEKFRKIPFSLHACAKPQPAPAKRVLHPSH